MGVGQKPVNLDRLELLYFLDRTGKFDSVVGWQDFNNLYSIPGDVPLYRTLIIFFEIVQPLPEAKQVFIWLSFVSSRTNVQTYDVHARGNLGSTVGLAV